MQTWKFPKSMAACADLLFIKRQERLDADKFAAGLKAEEEALITHIIDNLPKDSGGAIGKTHIVEVTTKVKQVVKDWPLYWAYVSKNKAWDLVQKRVGEAALQARLDDGKKVPGIEPFVVVGVSLRARPKK